MSCLNLNSTEPLICMVVYAKCARTRLLDRLCLTRYPMRQFTDRSGVVSCWFDRLLDR